MDFTHWFFAIYLIREKFKHQTGYNGMRYKALAKLEDKDGGKERNGEDQGRRKSSCRRRSIADAGKELIRKGSKEQSSNM